MESLGKIIETERKNKQLSQAKLGKIIGVSQDAISLWEKGKAKPNIDTILTLADYFEVSIDYLVGRESELGLVEIKGMQLTPIENELLKLFRRLNERQQDRVLGYMENMVS